MNPNPISPPVSPRLRILRDIHTRFLVVMAILIALTITGCAQRTQSVLTPSPSIDPAAAVTLPGSDLAWFDALQLGIDGQGWSGDDLKQPYDRLPAEAEGVVREAVWSLSQNSAGMSVRFVTDSPTITARWVLRTDRLDMHHMPSTGVSGVDLYAKDNHGEWRWVGAGRPKEKALSEWTLIKQAPPGEHEYQFYLPLYNGVESLHIGIEPGSTIRKAPAYDDKHNKPVLFWGTSILQGGCASRPGMAYPSILARRLHRPAINLGFSGNGKMDPQVTELIAQLDVAAYVIDCGPNMTADMIDHRTVPLVRTLRAANPDTPIVLIENIRYQHGWFIEETGDLTRAKNAQFQKAYKELKAEGIDKLYYVPCDDLLGDDAEATVDGVHPNDLGFMRMADAIAPTLRQALKQDRFSR